MVARRHAGSIPPHVVERLLGACDDSDVLVGGQALTVWVVKFGLKVPEQLPVITRDADFLAQSPTATETVKKFARAIDGTPRFPRQLALTALVGQVEFDVSAQEYLSVDIIFQVIGLDAKKVLERAVRVTFGAVAFQVMHPLDVLRSRLANLHQLQEKQNEKGALQLSLAIEVARKFLQSEAALASPADTAAGRSPLQTLVSEIERLALSDAGRKVAARWGQHVADAIDPSLIPAGPFWTRKWPTLRTLMSAAHADRFRPPDA
jgi:hypothetical protein